MPFCAFILGKSATFTFELTDPDKSKDITYIYPAAMAGDDDVNFDALATQDGTQASLSSTLDLATYSAAWNGTSLPAGTLVNQLAVCAFTLKNSDGSSPITSGLTGVTVNDGSNTYTVTPTGSNFGENVIYVAIRPVTAALEYTATDGTNNYTKTATSREYAAGNFYNLGLRMTALPSGALAGKFTINAGGTKVYFSQGNLQAVFASAGSICTWRFAANQWDVVGSAAANTSINGNGSVSAAGTVDLFGWVGASSSFTGNAQYGISNSTTINDYGSTADEALMSDWGNTIGGGWYTMSQAEWAYLFNTRGASTVNGTDNARFAKAYLFGSKHGIILFPDRYAHPGGVAAPTGINATDNTSWNANTYSTAEWAKMEAAGCVFLPSAGFRNGASVSISVTNQGHYWTSTISTSDVSYAYRVYFKDNSFNVTSSTNRRFYGYSVRLVRKAE